MRWYYYAATALYCAAIFVLSSQEELPDTQRLLPHGDKVLHAMVFGGLAALVSIGIRRSNDAVSPAIQCLVPFAFAAVYGLTDEIHQLFVRNRAFDLLDLAADAAGALLAQAILCLKVWKVSIGHETP